MRLTHNLHVHSVVSNCAGPEMLPADIAAQAQGCGIETLAITDHIDVEGESAREALVLSNIESIKRLSAKVRVLAGTETTMMGPGRVAASEETRRRLDIVLVAINHYHLRNVEHPAERTPRGYARHHLLMMRSAAQLSRVEVVVHPFAHTKLRGMDHAETLAAYDMTEVDDVLALLASNGLRLELNPGHVRHWPEFFARVVEGGREAGLRFTLGTDAHRLPEVCFGDGVGALLESIGVRDRDIALPERVGQ